MSSMTLGRTWDEAASPEVVRLAQRFESAWRAAEGTRPDPIEFLPARRASAPAPCWPSSAPTWPCDTRPASRSASNGINVSIRRSMTRPSWP